MKSGVVNKKQPAPPCGRIDDSGTDAVPKPVTASAIELAGMPVAVAVNVLPSHGRLVAMSAIGPALLAQLAPNGITVAGHVVVSSATYADTAQYEDATLPTIVNEP